MPSEVVRQNVKDLDLSRLLLLNDRLAVVSTGGETMSITSRILIAAPLALSGFAAGATPALADPFELARIDIAQPDPGPDPDPGPQIPGDKDGPNDPGPDGPGDIGIPDDVGDDDGDDDDGDRDDDDGDDGGVRRPTRVDAGDPSETGMNLAWLLIGGGAVTAAGGFTARKVALNRR